MGAIGKNGINCQNIIPHDAITDGSATTAVIGGHAANGCPTRGGNIYRKPQPMRLQLTVQFVKNNPGLNNAAPVFDIEFQNQIEVFCVIENQRVIDRLATLRCTATTRQ